MLKLEPIKRTDPRILADMAVHYSKPGGFVGRNICYAITYAGVYYGAIVGGSSTLHLIGRDPFFAIGSPDEKYPDMVVPKKVVLRRIVNNIFFHIEKVDGRYPVRNMVTRVLRMFRERVVGDWLDKYGDAVIGFESLVELPRTGEAYRRDGWEEVGITKGNTCKRISGKGKRRTDSWTGQRIWDTKNLRPKRVFVRFV